MQQTAIYNEQMASMQGSNRPLAAEQQGQTATATARLPVTYNSETRRVENAGYDCATITFYWNAAEQHLTKFVEENPILAAIVTVAFAILGLSFLVPSFIAGIVIGVPLVALAALLGKTIYDHKDIFLHNFLHQVRGEQLEVDDEGSQYPVSGFSTNTYQ